jgi:hypothetical protein
MAVLVSCASALVCAPVAGQSLADVARAEAERRATIAQPSRVYTDKDLKPARQPASASDMGSETGTHASPPPGVRGGGRGREVPRTSHAAAQPEADADAAADADKGSDEDARRTEKEQHWRGRMAEARDRVARSRTFAEALQSQINALTADFSARDDPAQRAAIGARLNGALAELDRVRGEIDVQQKAIADLEEEARRAGVPPGWLR